MNVSFATLSPARRILASHGLFNSRNPRRDQPGERTDDAVALPSFFVGGSWISNCRVEVTARCIEFTLVGTAPANHSRSANHILVLGTLLLAGKAGCDPEPAMREIWRAQDDDSSPRR